MDEVYSLRADLFKGHHCTTSHQLQRKAVGSSLQKAMQSHYSVTTCHKEYLQSCTQDKLAGLQVGWLLYKDKALRWEISLFQPILLLPLNHLSLEVYRGRGRGRGAGEGGRGGGGGQGRGERGGGGEGEQHEGRGEGGWRLLCLKKSLTVVLSFTSFSITSIRHSFCSGSKLRSYAKKWSGTITVNIDTLRQSLIQPTHTRRYVVPEIKLSSFLGHSNKKTQVVKGEDCASKSTGNYSRQIHKWKHPFQVINMMNTCAWYSTGRFWNKMSCSEIKIEENVSSGIHLEIWMVFIKPVQLGNGVGCCFPDIGGHICLALKTTCTKLNIWTWTNV